jgi:hypothetical protein
VASAAQRSGKTDAPEQSTGRDSGQDRSRLLPVLAVERVIHAVLLIGVGLMLWTHTHADWADVARGFVGRGGTRPESQRDRPAHLPSGGVGTAADAARRAIASGTERWRQWRATACCVVISGRSI